MSSPDQTPGLPMSRRRFLGLGLGVSAATTAAYAAARDPLGVGQAIAQGMAPEQVQGPEYTERSFYTWTDPFTGQIVEKHIGKKGFVADTVAGQPSFDDSRNSGTPLFEAYVPINVKNARVEWRQVRTPTPTPTERITPTPTASPTPTATATPTEAPSPTDTPTTEPSRTPEPAPSIEINLPFALPMLLSPHTESLWTTPARELTAKGSIIGVLKNGMVKLAINSADGTKSVFIRPEDAEIDTSEIPRLSEEEIIEKVIVSDGATVSIHSGDWYTTAMLPRGQMRNKTNTTDYHFDITAVPDSRATDTNQGFGLSCSVFDANGGLIGTTGCRLANEKGKLSLVEGNYDARSGKYTEKSYPLDIESERTDAIIRITGGDTVVLYLPVWYDERQAFVYEPYKQIPLSKPVDPESWWRPSVYAKNGKAIINNLAIKTGSNIDSPGDWEPDPTYALERLSDYIPRERLGIADPDPNASHANTNYHIMEQFGLLDMTTSAFEGRNAWALQLLLQGRFNEGIIGFPYDAIGLASLHSQRWHPSVTAEGIENTSLPNKYRDKTGRDEYIRAVIAKAIELGNTEAVILDGHFDGQGNVVNPWIRSGAGENEQQQLLIDELTTIHAADNNRSVILKMPRDFNLSGTNARKLFNKIAKLKDELQEKGRSVAIEGLYVYPQGSTEGELAQFLTDAAEQGLTVHVYGIADRQNTIRHDRRQKTSPEKVLEVLLQHKNGGQIIYDSDKQSGLPGGDPSPEEGTVYLITNDRNLSYKYSPLYRRILQSARQYPGIT